MSDLRQPEQTIAELAETITEVCVGWTTPNRYTVALAALVARAEAAEQALAEALDVLSRIQHRAEGPNNDGVAKALRTIAAWCSDFALLADRKERG